MVDTPGTVSLKVIHVCGHTSEFDNISKSAKTGGVPFGRHSVGRNMIEKMFLLKNKIDLSEKRNGKKSIIPNSCTHSKHFHI
jgi:hypothetical protein